MTHADPQLRTAIAVSKTLDPGAVANVAAIVMGQLAVSVDGLYEADGVYGPDGTRHAGIRNNVVVLKGRQGQINSLVDDAAAMNDVAHVAFSELGRSMSNSYTKYAELVRERQRDEVSIVAVGLAGPDDLVRSLTKKLSYYSG